MRRKEPLYLAALVFAVSMMWATVAAAGVAVSGLPANGATLSDSVVTLGLESDVPGVRLLVDGVDVTPASMQTRVLIETPIWTDEGGYDVEYSYVYRSTYKSALQDGRRTIQVVDPSGPVTASTFNVLALPTFVSAFYDGTGAVVTYRDNGGQLELHSHAYCDPTQLLCSYRQMASTITTDTLGMWTFKFEVPLCQCQWINPSFCCDVYGIAINATEKIRKDVYESPLVMTQLIVPACEHYGDPDPDASHWTDCPPEHR